YGLVRNSVLNIRGNPKYSAEQVTQAVFGTPVKILKKKGGWVYIQTPEKYLGWAESQIIQRLTTAEYPHWLKSEKLIVIEETPNYSEANSNSLIAKHVVKGAILEQKGNKSAKFVQVAIGENQVAYIPFNTVQTVSNWIKNRKFSVDTMVETSK